MFPTLGLTDRLKHFHFNVAEKVINNDMKIYFLWVRYCLRYPKLYVAGQQNLLFNKKVFAQSVTQGIISSFIIFGIPFAAYSSVSDDNDDEHYDDKHDDDDDDEHDDDYAL